MSAEHLLSIGIRLVRFAAHIDAVRASSKMAKIDLTRRRALIHTSTMSSTSLY